MITWRHGRSLGCFGLFSNFLSLWSVLHLMADNIALQANRSASQCIKMDFKYRSSWRKLVKRGGKRCADHQPAPHLLMAKIFKTFSVQQIYSTVFFIKMDIIFDQFSHYEIIFWSILTCWFWTSWPQIDYGVLGVVWGVLKGTKIQLWSSITQQPWK